MHGWDLVGAVGHVDERKECQAWCSPTSLVSPCAVGLYGRSDRAVAHLHE